MVKTTYTEEGWNILKDNLLAGFDKQDFGEWPWPRNKEGLKQCEEELAGEVENEFAVCRAWAAEEGIDISADAQSVKSSGGEHGDMGQDTDDPEADAEATETETDEVADDAGAEETEAETDEVEAEADDGEAETDTVAEDTETVTVESEAMTVSVETAKAEHDEVMQVLAALGETDDMDVVEQAANMLMGESDGDMDDEDEDEEEMDEAADDDEEVVDGTDDHHFAEEGEADADETDEVDKSADEDEDAIDRAEDDVMWKGTRGMPEGAQDAIAKDASDGDGSDPTHDRASVLEADK